jgi:hypothetical protein
MYSEEKERTNRLNDAVKVYLGFTSFIIGLGVLKVVTADDIAFLFKQPNSLATTASYLKAIGVILFCLSFVLFAISALFTILVLKVWQFERLCDPEQLVVKAVTMEGEPALLSTMIADFAIAANRNYEVNEKKARLLSYGLLALICALLSFGISWLFAGLIPKI